MLKNFQGVVHGLQTKDSKKRVAVVAAHDEHTLEAVIRAYKEQVCVPILIGKQKEIVKILKSFPPILNESTIINIERDEDAAKKAVELIRNGEADFIMKGKIQTADLLRVVVKKEMGLRGDRMISHIAIFEIPLYHKLLAITDGGMVMYPSLDDKRQIIENAVEVFHTLGYSTPKVAILSAIETINPKMLDTTEADDLKQMNERGEIKNCIVEGPISYDLAMSEDSAAIKGYKSTITGDVDILVVPSITVGNILAKALCYSAGAKMAGIVVGAKTPIVLTSRGSSAEEKYLSLVLAAATAK